MCCFICDSWENNQLSSKEAFILIGNSLKSIGDIDSEESNHLIELCDRIVDSLDKYKNIH